MTHYEQGLFIEMYGKVLVCRYNALCNVITVNHLLATVLTVDHKLLIMLSNHITPHVVHLVVILTWHL